MSLNSVAPVERGQTYYGPTQTIDTGDYAGISLEGKRALFLDNDSSDSAKFRTARVTKAILMRNMTGGIVYAGYAVTPYSGSEDHRFDASYDKACQAVGIVDDRLGTGGCRAGDLCWVLIAGPAYYKTASSPARDTAVGDLLYVVDDDEGRLDSWQAALTFSATDVVDGDLASILANSLGRALESSETSDTDTSKLIDLGAATFG